MIDDTERREVAARLRKAIGLHEFAEVLGFSWTDDSDWGWNDVSNVVAELIEPPRQCPCYDSGKHRCSIHDVPTIDREALLALADEMEELGNLPVKHPGVRVLHNDDFSRELGYARRIREAVGVNDG